MNNKIIALLLLYGAIAGNSHAQGVKAGQFITSDYFSNFTPSNPSQAALGSFGNVPINYYTGLPEVSLNLLTLPSRDLSLPVSVNYDATGVRVDDIASEVGLKWSLNAGGYVVRQLNGLPDEHPTLGFFKTASQINTTGTLDVATLVQHSEQNISDCEPDEFVAYFAGRSVKFFIKDNIPVPVPHQKIKIQYFSTDNKLTKFVITTEDGFRYTFGSDANAIEEKKIENLSMTVNFNFKSKGDFYNVSGQPDPALADYFYTETDAVRETIFSTKTQELYNSKWYLVKMESSTNDFITFTYTKQGTQKYVTQPAVTRKTPLLTTVSNFTYSLQRVCIDYYDPPLQFLCSNHVDLTFTQSTPTVAYAAYSSTCPDFTSCVNLPAAQVTNTRTDLFFNPHDDKVEPGGIFINQSLITESVIVLDNITTATNNKVKFYTSTREDLPGAVKYDKIELINMSNKIVKTIQLNYLTSEAVKTKNYMWLSEAFLFGRISRLPAGNFYAEDVRWYTETDIDASSGLPDPSGLNAICKKYIYEGMKAYNYKRLFLKEIKDIAPGAEKLLYAFEYNNVNQMVRRISPKQDVNGFTNQLVSNETYTLPNGGVAYIANALNPTTRKAGNPTQGQLLRIQYPTGGYTGFVYASINRNLLEKIVDNDGVKQVSSREISVLADKSFAVPAVLTSYQNSKVGGTEKYKRFKIETSYPQNRSFANTHGVTSVNTKVRVYNGSAADHLGYEEYVYRSDDDEITPVRSWPKDINAAGNEIDEIKSAIVFPFPRRKNKEHLRGLLSEHTVFRKDGSLASHTRNEYTLNPDSYVPVKILGFQGGSFPYDGGSKYRYGRYELVSEWVVLNKSKNIVYDPQFPSDTTHNFRTTVYNRYDSKTLQVAESETVVGSDRVLKKTKYAAHSDYDAFAVQDCDEQFNTCVSACMDEACRNQCNSNYDYNSCQSASGTNTPEANAIVRLRNRNQHATPVEVQTIQIKDNTSVQTSAVLYTYGTVNANNFFVRPTAVYGANSFRTSPFETSRINSDGSFTKDSSYRLLHTYNEYDSDTGNIILQTASDGTVTQYNWDASINKSAVQKVTVNPSAPYPKVSAFTTTPLVGITQVTDPNLVSTYFQYDDFGRLWTSTDHDRKVIAQYGYHYATEPKKPFTASFTVTGAKVTGNWLTFIAENQKRNSFGTTTYTWNYGDGSTETFPVNTDQGPTSNGHHAYAASGSYVVTLTISDPDYGSATASATIIVFSSPSVSICANGPVKVNKGCRRVMLASSCSGSTTYSYDSPTTLVASGSGGCGTLTYVWEFKDSNTPGGTWQSLSNGSVPGGFSNRTIGTYTVRCRVVDACGNYSNYSNEIQLAVFTTTSC